MIKTFPRSSIIEPLESRTLLSAAVPLAASTASAPAQHRYQDPFVQILVNGKTVKKGYVLNFGRLPLSSAPVTKTVTLVSLQGGFPFDNAKIRTPTDFSILYGTSSEPDRLPLQVTFTPTTVGHSHGTVVIPTSDNSGYVLALNVSAVVLPPPSVQISRIDIGRLPNLAGGDHSKGTAHLKLTNVSDATLRGPVTIQLFASTDQNFSATDDLLLGTAKRAVKVAADHTNQLNLKFQYPVPPESGNYYIFAVASGDRMISPAGGVYLSPIQQTIQKPEISLAGVPTQTPSYTTNNPTRVVLPVINKGNITAFAKIDATLYSTADAGSFNPSTAQKLDSYTNLNYRIRPGRTILRRVRVSQSIPAGQEIIAVITAIHLPSNLNSFSTSEVPDIFRVR